MRKAICPQPIKRIYFYNRQEEANDEVGQQRVGTQGEKAAC